MVRRNQQQDTSRPVGGRFARGCGGCIAAVVLLIAGFVVAYLHANSTPELILPGHSMPADNAMDYFVRANDAALKMQHPSPLNVAAPPGKLFTLADYRGCAVDAQPALALLQVGLQHPCMQKASRSAKTIYPEYAKLRNMERVASGAADYYELAGQPERALEIRLDGLEMGAMIPRGGNLIAGLVGIACDSIAESRIEPLLPQLTASQLDQCAKRLDNIAAKRVPYGDVMIEEGYSHAAALQETMRDPKSRSIHGIEEMLMLDTSGAAPMKERAQAYGAVFRYMMEDKKQAVRQNLKWFKAIAEESRLPYTGPSKVALPDNIFMQMIGPVFENSRRSFVRDESAFQVLRVETALFRYRAANNRFPGSLAELTPAYLGVVPADPCGGKALHYTFGDGGRSFCLYGVGPDLVDHGGNPGRYPGDAGADIVAGKMWRTKPLLLAAPQAR